MPIAEYTLPCYFAQIVMVLHHFVVGYDRSPHTLVMAYLGGIFPHSTLHIINPLPDRGTQAFQLLEKSIISIGTIPALGLRPAVSFSEGTGNGSAVLHLYLGNLQVRPVQSSQDVLIHLCMPLEMRLEVALRLLAYFLNLRHL
jgi:hypothetical protein